MSGTAKVEKGDGTLNKNLEAKRKCFFITE